MSQADQRGAAIVALLERDAELRSEAAEHRRWNRQERADEAEQNAQAHVAAAWVLVLERRAARAAPAAVAHLHVAPRVVCRAVGTAGART